MIDIPTLLYGSIGLSICFGYLGMTVYALYYMRIKFYNKLRPAYKPDWYKEQEIPVAIFIPCKGLSEQFEQNMERFIQLEYNHHTIICITESDKDPAVPILQKLSQKHAHFHHVVAEYATQSCQKNHNLLAGIQYITSNKIPAELYLFADADVRPQTDWLDTILAPLSDASVFAVSGFRWLAPRTKAFPNQLHAVFNAYLGLIMTQETYAGIWGGSVAIRKYDFEKYHVFEKWAHAMVDDIALSWIIKKHKLRRVFSPDCMVYSQETIGTLSTVVDWFTRQCQYGSQYLRGYAAFGMILNILMALLMWSLPVIIVLFILQLISPIMLGLGVVFYGLSMLNFGLLKGYHKDDQSPLRWILYTPFILFWGAYCGWKGFWSKTMLWAGIRYRINRKGEVLSVHRPDNS